MKRIIYIFGVLLLLSSLSAVLSIASDESLIYHAYSNEASTEVIAKTTITTKQISDDQTVINRQKQSKNCMVEDEFVLDREYSLERWTRVCLEDDTEYTAERKGEFLIIQGKVKGEVVNKKLEIGRKALYVYPKYNLSKFALSGMPKMKFWTIRRDQLTKLPMQATRKGVEMVIINGEEVEAIKVYYSIASKIREKFYNHNYYYRTTDGLFIKKEEPGGRIEKLVSEE